MILLLVVRWDLVFKFIFINLKVKWNYLRMKNHIEKTKGCEREQRIGLNLGMIRWMNAFPERAAATGVRVSQENKNKKEHS